MRAFIRLLFVALIVLAASAAPSPRADAANHDTTADRVFGQPDFVHNTPKTGALSATNLSYPFGVAVDTQGNLYLADTNNSRVIEYDRPFPLLGLFLPLVVR